MINFQARILIKLATDNNGIFHGFMHHVCLLVSFHLFHNCFPHLCHIKSFSV